MDFLNKEDLKQTYTIQVCQSINLVLGDLIDDLNNILFGNFKTKRISKALFRKYRGKYLGFNNTFSFDFIIYLYDQLQESENVSNIILPFLKEYLINQDLIDVSIKDIVHNRTIKVSPFIREKLSNTKDDLNEKLKEFFAEDTVRDCLHREIRGQRQKPFTHHYMIDFLIFLFNQIKLSELDLKDFIIPAMDSYLRIKERIIIIEDEDGEEKKENSRG